MTIYPLKKFGQNFLQNNNIANEIIKNLQIVPGDTIIEIGPGKGVLCRQILEEDFSRYDAIEVDPRFIDELKPLFRNNNKANLIIGDIQNFSFEKYSLNNNRKIKIVGNIPFNLTSSIIFKLMDNWKFIKEAVLMIQKEVAERLMASPGTKDYGILSIIVQTQSEIKLIRHIRAENFFPIPKVNSTVIKMIFHEEIDGVNDINFFRKIVRKCFQARRKTLKNNLIRYLGNSEIKNLKEISLSRRPEELTINEYKILVNEIEKLKT